MDLRQLTTFRFVAELGSLSKASDRLRVAQPALSRQIKLLEHELKIKLFARNGRGMVLTAAGQLLLDRTTGLVRQIEQVRDDIQSVSGKPSGHVVLGLVPTVSCVLSARFARRIVEELPEVSLRIVESYGDHLVEWLHRGEMDLAIIYGPSVDLHLSVQLLGRDDCRGGRPSRMRTGATKACGHRLACPAKTGVAKSSAWPPRPDREGRRSKASAVEGIDRSRLFSRSHKHRRRRAGIYASATFGRAY